MATYLKRVISTLIPLLKLAILLGIVLVTVARCTGIFLVHRVNYRAFADFMAASSAYVGYRLLLVNHDFDEAHLYLMIAAALHLAKEFYHDLHWILFQLWKLREWYFRG